MSAMRKILPIAAASTSKEEGLVTEPGTHRFDYHTAFSRNLGLLSAAEQERLAHHCVAIPGMGGVGAIHLATLARLGVGSFKIADPDVYELANFNRQFGATLDTVEMPKVEAMAKWVAAVNPCATVETLATRVGEDNVSAFLDDVDLVIDGLDYFSIPTRRLVFREAARRGLYVITAGPIGFSAAVMIFDPNGMSFDNYFDLHDGQDEVEQRIRFGIGLSPRATQLAYIDMSKVDARNGTGPSLGLATNLCAGIATTEAVRILLHRRKPRCAPWYFQFDPYRWIYKKGYMPWGNRNPVQRAKIWYLNRRFR